MIHRLKKALHYTDDVTYHVMPLVECNGLFKNKSWYRIGFRFRNNALHFTVPTTMQPHYSTAIHCNAPRQTQDSWAESDRIPISKRCNNVRNDSASRVLLQSRFTRHTFPQHEIWSDQIQWKWNGPSPFQAVWANSDKLIIFISRFIGVKHNIGPKTIQI